MPLFPLHSWVAMFFKKWFTRTKCCKYLSGHKWLCLPDREDVYMSNNHSCTGIIETTHSQKCSWSSTPVHKQAWAQAAHWPPVMWVAHLLRVCFHPEAGIPRPAEKWPTTIHLTCPTVVTIKLRTVCFLLNLPHVYVLLEDRSVLCGKMTPVLSL